MDWRELKQRYVQLVDEELFAEHAYRKNGFYYCKAGHRLHKRFENLGSLKRHFARAHVDLWMRVRVKALKRLLYERGSLPYSFVVRELGLDPNLAGEVAWLRNGWRYVLPRVEEK